MGQRGVVGVSNSTDFLRSHSVGELRAVAEPVHASRTQHIWKVVISRSSDGKPVARGQVRFQVLDRLPVERAAG
jgi:acyl-coenzyme A thioesterase PaaI-like protein